MENQEETVSTAKPSLSDYKREVKLDKWQQEVMDYEGNICIRAGRQVGKSTVISMKAIRFAQEHPNSTTIIIAASQRQSGLLFEKIRAEFDIIHETAFRPYMKFGMKWFQKKEVEEEHGIYEDSPTQTRISLKNGSKIYSLPAGRTGVTIRGFSIDMLIVDEAAYIPESVWNAVIPMIAVSKETRGLGSIILLSSPFGKGGYFFQACHDPDFRQWHISSEDCIRIPRDFLKKERSRMSKMEYAQEYLGDFVDEFDQLFKTELIRKRMTFMEWEYEKEYSASKTYYIGVDIARFGGDENAFIIGEIWKDKLKIVAVETTERKGVTDTIGRIKALDKLYHFRRILIDSGGVGGAVYDILCAEMGKYRIIGLDNSSREVGQEGRKTHILKEDLYSHAISLMEYDEEGKPKKIEIIDNMRLARSLKGMTFEYTKDGNIRIHGGYSHLAEAFVRCCWATKAKGLKLFAA